MFDKKGGRCVLHGRMCVPAVREVRFHDSVKFIPADVRIDIQKSPGVTVKLQTSDVLEHLYIAGFVCKDFSMLNTGRFTRDCLTEGNQDHFATLLGTLAHLRLRRPLCFVLENAAGLKCSPLDSDVGRPLELLGQSKSASDVFWGGALAVARQTRRRFLRWMGFCR